jgi:hypothetical protein
MTITVFTIFDAADSSKSAQVYAGQFKERAELQRQPPAYTVRIEGRNISVYASPSHGGHVLLSGTLEGLTNSHVLMVSFNKSAQVRNDDIFKGAWAFVDFEGKKYVWDVEFWGGAWKLVYATKTTITSFDRKAWKSDIEGHLSIHTSIPESLLILIILTNKLVHNRVKSSEQASTNWRPSS